MIFIPLYAHHLGISVGVIGLITAIPSLQEAFFRLPGGWLTDRIGEIRVLTLAMWMAVAAALLYQTGTGLWWLGLGQIAYGFSMLGFWSAAPAYVTKLGGSNVEGRVGLFVGAVGLGAIIGPLLSGQVFAFRGYPGTFMFFLVVSLGCAAVVRFLPPPRREVSKRGTAGSIFLLKYRVVQVGAMACFIAAIPTALAGSLFPVYIVEVGYSELFPATLSSVRAAAMALVSASTGLWMSRVSHFRAAVGLMLLSGLAIVAVPLFYHNVWVLGLASAVMGAAAGSLWVLATALVRSGIPLGSLALGLAYTNIFWPINVVLVRVGSGWISQIFTSTLAFLCVGAMALGIALFAAVLLRRELIMGIASNSGYPATTPH